jgi:tRNA dimethylallyltransferase
MNAFLKGYSLPGDAPEKKDRERLRKKTPEELRLLLKKLSPDALAKLKDPRNPYRIIRAIEKILYPGENEIPFSNKISPLLLGVYFHRKTVHSRIEERLLSRLDKGMEEEVRRLHENGVSWEKLDRFGLEYRYMSYFLKGEMSREEVREQLLFKIRGFAKSQDIWFRKMERKGTVIHWIKKGDFDKATRIVRLFLEDKPLPPPEIRMMDIHYGPKDRN